MGTRAGVRLAVDVGEVRVGLAATDPDALVATPVMTLRRSASGSDQRMLIKIAADRAAKVIFVGLPLSLSGTETASTQAARDYAEHLVSALGEALLEVEVRLVDERLTTVSAAEKMRSAGRKAKNQREAIDQAAAVEILNHALETRAALGTEPGHPVFPRG